MTMSRAIAPVAAEIMPGRPPVKAMIAAMLKEAYRPTLGSTPAMIEKAMASGISASATTRPASRSFRTLDSQSWRKDFNIGSLPGMGSATGWSGHRRECVFPCSRNRKPSPRRNRDGKTQSNGRADSGEQGKEGKDRKSGGKGKREAERV